MQRVCCETLDWALEEMRGPEGGFYSALDADSEGVEGRFYVWTVAELRARLGDLAEQAIEYFGASERGNFERGENVLTARRQDPQHRDEIRALLLDARAQRTRPGLDDKRLTAWNALMIAALAEAGAALERTDYVQAALAATEFVLSELRAPDGRLLRTWKDGHGRIDAYLEDYAFLLEALMAVYEATFEERYYTQAVAVADQMIERFADPEHGGFFTTARELEPLVTRRKDLEDSPIPSGNSSAALGLLRLALVSGEGRYERYALGVLRLLLPPALRYPSAFGHLLQGADFYLARGARGGDRRTRRPSVCCASCALGIAHMWCSRAAQPGDAVPLLEGREPVEGKATAYVCEHFACKAPVTSPDELAAAL